MSLPDDPQALQALLEELKLEHHDLDASIARLEENPPHDELLLRRLKKRKLLLKDRIAAVERLLGPDLIA
ncbi:MAG: YdcH family protein [Pseudomonadota bacterium]